MPNALRETASSHHPRAPGVFKNAADWLSRPPSDIPKVLGNRPVAMIGASPGGFGTILAQDAWLPVQRKFIDGFAAFVRSRQQQ